MTSAKQTYERLRTVLKIVSAISIVLVLITSQIATGEQSKLYQEEISLVSKELFDEAIINRHLGFDKIDFDTSRWGSITELRFELRIYFNTYEERCVVDNVGEVCGTEIIVTELESVNYTASINITTSTSEVKSLSSIDPKQEYVLTFNAFTSLSMDILVDASKSLDRAHDEFIVDIDLRIGNEKTFDDPYWSPYIWTYYLSLGLAILTVSMFILFPLLFSIIQRYRIVCQNCGTANERKTRICTNCGLDYMTGWKLL